MFINDIFKKKLNEGGFDIPEIPRAPQPKPTPTKDKTVDEAGPFSYGAKKPRKGSVADLAAKKRKEQERDKQPVEPKDHMVGVARVVKEGEDLSQYSTERLQAYVKKVSGGGVPAFGSGAKLKRVQAELKRRQQGVAEGLDNSKITVNKIDAYDDPNIEEWHVYRGKEMIGYIIKNQPDTAEGLYIASGYGPGRGFTEEFNGLKSAVKYITSLDNQGVAEGSVQDKLYKRHQELRKKSGLPDPDYYKELKASYDLPDAERYAKQKEIKQKYKVTNEDRERYIEELQRAGYELVTEKRMTCPECGGAAYEDKILAEKQDACYHKVKSRYKVWPSAYASGALVKCRKKGAKNWGNKSK